ncbi:chromate transporter [Paracraurococcus lichenis]|uniref:Chromate transporter n=1 Tax=Paracraurococcus lichenis TaxID=3064888 RepID=A0ABT9E2R5_9PROT|nr:chromate transporter [Paracraurococcus sp. LOR1-02]MDO9710449.1 chromate transporter [Paracraurococcus sp. LOR1-02]
MPDAPPTTVVPSRADLFLGYLKIGLFGFGGVAAWARRVIVEERHWLTEREYAEVLGLGQVLPGPNVGNAAVMIGRRFHGLPGALLATGGIYCAPLLILIGLCLLYERYGQLPAVAPAMAGIAAAAAGMVIGTAIKMVVKLKLAPEAIGILILAAFAAAWLRLPLPLIVLALAPLSIAASLWRAGLILRDEAAR